MIIKELLNGKDAASLKFVNELKASKYWDHTLNQFCVPCTVLEPLHEPPLDEKKIPQEQREQLQEARRVAERARLTDYACLGDGVLFLFCFSSSAK